MHAHSRRPLAILLVAVLAIVGFSPLAHATANPGRLVVDNDEYTVADVAFNVAPTSTSAFVLNVGSVFANGGHGHFLAVDSFAFGDQFQAKLLSAGHSVDVGTAPFSLATLTLYDGVFLVGAANTPDPDFMNALIQYIDGGGNVYLSGGTGGPESTYWAPLLNTYGLQFGADNNIWDVRDIVGEASPLTVGVTQLENGNGNYIEFLGEIPSPLLHIVAVDSSTEIPLIVVYEGQGASVPAPELTTLALGLGGLGLVGIVALTRRRS